LLTADAGDPRVSPCVMVSKKKRDGIPTNLRQQRRDLQFFVFYFTHFFIFFNITAGAHVKHNEACGDNVGPLLVKKE
jgi:hypothetical protein